MNIRQPSMKQTLLASTLVAGLAMAGLSGCTSIIVPVTSEGSITQNENRGEHQREGGEGEGDEHLRTERARILSGVDGIRT